MSKKKIKTYLCRGEPAGINGVPTAIKILPLGYVSSQKGDFLVDDQSFKLMSEEMLRRKLDKVIDYEHQTLMDVQAPAAGWIKNLKLEDDAITAEVEWTKKAEEYLKNGEYRYLSPVIRVNPADNRAICLHSVALTNTPAIDGMFAILKDNDEIEMEENDMDLKELAVLLGLPEDASLEQIKEAITKVLGEVTALKETETPVADKMVCKLLDVAENAKLEDVSAAIMALKAGKDDTVSKSEYQALKARLDEKDSEDAVEMALKDGKITPAQREWAKEYALKDLTGFKAFCEKAPQVVPASNMVPPETKPEASGEAELVACKALGVSKEDIEKYGKEGK